MSEKGGAPLDWGMLAVAGLVLAVGITLFVVGIYLPASKTSEVVPGPPVKVGFLKITVTGESPRGTLRLLEGPCSTLRDGGEALEYPIPPTTIFVQGQYPTDFPEYQIVCAIFIPADGSEPQAFNILFSSETRGDLPIYICDGCEITLGEG